MPVGGPGVGWVLTRAGPAVAGAGGEAVAEAAGDEPTGAGGDEATAPGVTAVEAAGDESNGAGGDEATAPGVTPVGATVTALVVNNGKLLGRDGATVGPTVGYCCGPVV